MILILIFTVRMNAINNVFLFLVNGPIWIIKRKLRLLCALSSSTLVASSKDVCLLLYIGKGGTAELNTVNVLGWRHLYAIAEVFSLVHFHTTKYKKITFNTWVFCMTYSQLCTKKHPVSVSLICTCFTASLEQIILPKWCCIYDMCSKFNDSLV